MNERRSSTIILSRVSLVLILALSAFIQYSVVTRTTMSIPMDSDASSYFSYAYNLKHSGVYSNLLTWSGEAPPTKLSPDSLRSPGYPLFLLAIPGLDTTDKYLRRVAWVQGAMGVGSVWLVFLIASRFLPVGWSHSAAAITATSPHLAILSTCLLTESLFLLLLLASIHVTLLAQKTKRRKAFIAAGLLWGICSLVRPTVLFIPPLLLVATFVVPKLYAWRKFALLMFAGFFFIQSPWHVRNQLTALDPAQGSLMVFTLHHGSYPGFMYEDRPETYGWPFRFAPRGEDAERDLSSALFHIAKKFQEQPWTYARWYLLGKPGFFLSWGYVQGHDIYVYETPRSPFKDDVLFVTMRAVAYYLHWPLMLLGLSAAFLVWWRPQWLRIENESLLAAKMVSIIVLYAIAFHMIAAPFPRYGVPFRPLLYTLALTLVSALIAGKQRSRPNSRNEQFRDNPAAATN